MKVRRLTESGCPARGNHHLTPSAATYEVAEVRPTGRNLIGGYPEVFADLPVEAGGQGRRVLVVD